ncbi:MAG: RHS repeat-associated core domain-containing protein [Acidobacteria bacterium]|nr:RHS repeat-associated core domain-containing protein [Acidobacteriota bacterium]
MGRVSSESYSHWDAGGPSTFVLSALYQFNKLGNRTQIVYPNPQGSTPRRTVNMTYNPMGRLTTIHNYYEAVSGTGIAPDFDVVSGVSYNVGGTLDSFTYGNGLVENRTYEANRRQLTNLKVTNPSPASTIMDYTYSYIDANGKNNGQLQQATDNVDATKTQQYSYDSVSRLSQFKLGPVGAPTTTMNFSYDPYGNRTAQSTTGPGPTMNLTYDDATNRITTTGYGYDNNGNLTAAPGPNVYRYDLANRMTSVTVGGTVQGTYGYDGRGLRIRKVAGTTETFYFHTRVGLLGEYTRPAGTTQAPTLAKEYVYRKTRAILTVTNGVRTYNHKDRLGGGRKMTDANANVTATHDYYPFGEEVVPTANNDQKFTGYYRDSESGIDYAQQRYYNTPLGRFLTVDPYRGTATKPQTFNRYSYVAGDPINRNDPNGLCMQSLWTDDDGRIIYGDWDMLCSGGGGFGFITGDPPSWPSPDDGDWMPPADRTTTAWRGQVKQRVIDLISDRDCGNFITKVISNFLRDTPGTRTPAEESYINDQIENAVNNILRRVQDANYVDTQQSGVTRLRGGRTRTEYARADYDTQTVRLNDPFWNQDLTGQAQTLIHEAFHLQIAGLGDEQLAEAARVTVRRDETASQAFQRELNKNCK